MKQLSTPESPDIRSRVSRKILACLLTIYLFLLASAGSSAQSITISGTVYDDSDGGTISGTPISKVDNQQLYVYLIDSTNTVVDAAVVSELNGSFSTTGVAYSNYNVALSSNVQPIGTSYPNLGLPDNYVPTAEGTTSAGDGTPDFAVAINSASGIVINYAIDARPEGYAYAIQRPTYDSLRRIIIPPNAFGGQDLEDGIYATGLTGRRIDLYQATGGLLYYYDTLISFSSASTATRIVNFQSSALRFVATSSTIRAFAYSIVDNAGVVELVPNSVSIGAPLPITLTRFYGAPEAAGNELFWQTATESNSAGFELQRSRDGQSFIKLAYIPSRSENGRSLQPLDYSFTDGSVTELQAGPVYYRLRQIDRSGESTISNTVVMAGGKSQEGFRLAAFPNPCSSAVSLDLGDEGSAADLLLTLSTASGQLVRKYTYHTGTGHVSTSLDLSACNDGLYFLHVVASNGTARSLPLVIRK